MLPYAFNRMGISSGGGIPTQGLIYYAPLTSKKSTDELGNNLTFQEVGMNWNFGVIDGVPCAYSNYTAGFGKGAWIYSSTPLWTSKPTPVNMHYTMSWWMRRGTGDNGQAMFNMGYGNTVNYDFMQAKGTGTEGLVLWRRLTVQSGNLIATPTTYPHESWLYCTLVWEGEQTKMYVNGTLIGTESTAYASLNQSGNMLWALGWWLNLPPNTSSIGGSTDYNKNSAYSALRIYNRVLSQNEINTLKNEFNPTN